MITVAGRDDGDKSIIIIRDIRAPRKRCAADVITPATDTNRFIFHRVDGKGDICNIIYSGQSGDNYSFTSGPSVRLNALVFTGILLTPSDFKWHYTRKTNLKRIYIYICGAVF